MIRSPDPHKWSKWLNLVAISASALVGRWRGCSPCDQATSDSVNGKTRFAEKGAHLFSAFFAFGALAGCAGGERIGGPLIMEIDATSPVSVLSAINENAQACWVRSGGSRFRGLAVVPELDTRAGNPRLLVVERGKAEGLPKLVIEASGSPVKIVTYGPLASSGLSARINDNIIDWSAGRSGC